jgi:hypothetical protein
MALILVNRIFYMEYFEQIASSLASGVNTESIDAGHPSQPDRPRYLGPAQ